MFTSEYLDNPYVRLAISMLVEAKETFNREKNEYEVCKLTIFLESEWFTFLCDALGLDINSTRRAITDGTPIKSNKGGRKKCSMLTN